MLGQYGFLAEVRTCARVCVYVSMYMCTHDAVLSFLLSYSLFFSTDLDHCISTTISLHFSLIVHYLALCLNNSHLPSITQYYHSLFHSSHLITTHSLLPPSPPLPYPLPGVLYIQWVPSICGRGGIIWRVSITHLRQKTKRNSRYPAPSGQWKYW